MAAFTRLKFEYHFPVLVISHLNPQQYHTKHQTEHEYAKIVFSHPAKRNNNSYIMYACQYKNNQYNTIQKISQQSKQKHILFKNVAMDRT